MYSKKDKKIQDGVPLLTCGAVRRGEEEMAEEEEEEEEEEEARPPGLCCG